MAKMRLDLEAIEVQSFVTGYAGGLGTVRAAQATSPPCASEVNSCNCTLNLAVEGCGTQQEPCGGGGSATCAEGPNTCAYGCTLGYRCTDYCNGSDGGTCAAQTCFSACGGDTCGCNGASGVGTCAYGDTCGGPTCDNAACPGHSGAWCTVRCAGTHGLPDGPTCDVNCIAHTDEQTCAGCTGGPSIGINTCQTCAAEWTCGVPTCPLPNGGG